jgi:hypothetical protein
MSATPLGQESMVQLQRQVHGIGSQNLHDTTQAVRALGSGVRRLLNLLGLSVTAGFGCAPALADTGEFSFT